MAGSALLGRKLHLRARNEAHEPSYEPYTNAAYCVLQFRLAEFELCPSGFVIEPASGCKCILVRCAERSSIVQYFCLIRLSKPKLISDCSLSTDCK